MGLDGLALRLGGIGSTAGGIGLLVKHCDRNSSILECSGPAVLILAGVGLFFGGTFYDLGEVRHDAERHNARLTLLPSLHPPTATTASPSAANSSVFLRSDNQIQYM